MKESTKETLKKALKFTAIIIPIAAIGGYFTGKYAYASYTEDVQQLILSQVGSVQNLALVSLVQSVMYAVFCALIGYFLAENIGLMKPLKYEKETLKKTAIITLFAVFYLGWIIGLLEKLYRKSQKQPYESEITIQTLITGWHRFLWWCGRRAPASVILYVTCGIPYLEAVLSEIWKK